MSCGLAVVGQDSDATRRLVERLDREIGVGAVVIERAPRRTEFLAARVRRLGPVTVLGQVLFQVVVFPWLRLRGRARLAELDRAHNLRDAPIPVGRRHDVGSVNALEAHNLFRALDPEVVVLAGPRILSAETLAALPGPVVNVHAGITPRYRGVHGAYWALARRDPGGCGVTVHLVDEGVDTGDVIVQVPVVPERQDSFATYPRLQLGAAMPALVDALRRRAATGTPLTGRAAVGESRAWAHPTIWGYLARRLGAGVR